MKERCLNPNSTRYADYGGRGIAVCDAWRESFENFFADLGPKPSAQHQLERDDNTLGYGPENCRWATRSEQGQNKRNNRNFTINGETYCLAEWCRRHNVDEKFVAARLTRGWEIERALTAPVRYNGKRTPAAAPVEAATGD